MEDLGPLADLADRELTIRTVAGRQVVLARMGEHVYALRNICPHQTQSFIEGDIRNRVVSGAVLGEVEVIEGDPVVTCPWHGYAYSALSGQCLVDPGLRVRTYPVAVHDGRVLLDLGVGVRREAAEPEGR